ncbi:hypothetical protein NDU88_005410 [Pleurodeles waltl]|uniref:Uncharacterized protein n=1 Tax=Pleurodeles waltl TaxID=8319 RepID=A0AAV7TBH5_PLEWA|nr:hypothetical protein NDU88_005410 [Pleurodeles waltl]
MNMRLVLMSVKAVQEMRQVSDPEMEPSDGVLREGKRKVIPPCWLKDFVLGYIAGESCVGSRLWEKHPEALHCYAEVGCGGVEAE